MSTFILDNDKVMVNGFNHLGDQLCFNMSPDGMITVTDWEHRNVNGFYVFCKIEGPLRYINDCCFEKMLRFLGIDSRTKFVWIGDVYALDRKDEDAEIVSLGDEEPLGDYDSQADKLFRSLTDGITTDYEEEPSSHKSISSFERDDIVQGHYLLTGVQIGTTKNGSTYLRAVAQDKTGKIPIVFWDYCGDLSEADNGEVVYLEGTVGAYDDKPQLCLTALELAVGGKYWFYDLVPLAPINVEAAVVDLLKLVFSIVDTDYRKLCMTMLCRHRQAFLYIPAAKSVHHAFLHGLLMHTLNVAKTVDFCANGYGDFLVRDLLITGAILHDIGKIQEFEVSSCGLVKDYTIKGSISNHLIMGAEEVKEVAKSLEIRGSAIELLCHMILSHHGKFEYGAAVLPCLAEAELLHMADDMDAKLESCRAVLESTNIGAFTEKIFALGNRRMLNHIG